MLRIFDKQESAYMINQCCKYEDLGVDACFKEKDKTRKCKLCTYRGYFCRNWLRKWPGPAHLYQPAAPSVAWSTFGCLFQHVLPPMLQLIVLTIELEISFLNRRLIRILAISSWLGTSPTSVASSFLTFSSMIVLFLKRFRQNQLRMTQF